MRGIPFVSITCVRRHNRSNRCTTIWTNSRCSSPTASPNRSTVVDTTINSPTICCNVFHSCRLRVFVVIRSRLCTTIWTNSRWHRHLLLFQVVPQSLTMYPKRSCLAFYACLLRASCPWTSFTMNGTTLFGLLAGDRIDTHSTKQ